MKNKTKVVRFRVTDEQRETLEKVCGGDMSAYIIKKLFNGITFNPPEKDVEKIRKVSVVDILEKDLEINPERKCCSPGCQSTNTMAYLRGVGTFWLCDTHKP